MDHLIRKIRRFISTGIILAASSAFITQSWREFLLNATANSLHLLILEKLFRELYSYLEDRNQKSIIIWNRKIIGLIITETVLVIVQYEHILQLLPLIISWLLAFIGFLKELIEARSLGYDSGMAYSFYFGYLKLLLPSLGDERQGIIELIDIYESTHHIQFAAKKLFILIPTSAHCPPSVADRSKFMEVAGSLKWRRINRAGVTARQYHHAVYKLWVNQQEHPIYVCVEYATPLLTLYEIMSQNTEESRLYRRHRDRLVKKFYTTLQMVINNDRDCRDLVELIYYSDVDQDGNPLNLDQLDVGNLILARIN